MNFDLEKLRKFKETFSMLKEIDDCSKGGDKYLLFFENRMEIVDGITFTNLDGVKYFAVLVRKLWNNMGYTNTRTKLLGMFDENFNLTRKIPLPNGRDLVDIKFKKYPSVYYDEHQPVFVVEGADMEKKEIEVSQDERLYCEKELMRLYELALEL